MIRTVLVKLTVRPWPSVSRPSSMICSSDVEDVGVGLLDLVEQDDRVGPAAHRLGQLAALLVADVAGRRADQPRDGVLLHVLGHVDADDRLLGVEHELGQRPGELGLADAGRAEEEEGADRPVRVGEPGARAAQRVGDRLDRLVLADHPLVEALLHVDQLLDLALHQPRDRDPGPLGDDLGDVLLGHLLGQHRAALVVQLGEPRLLLGDDLSRARGCSPYRSFGRALEVAVALGPLGLAAGLLELAPRAS